MAHPLGFSSFTHHCHTLWHFLQNLWRFDTHLNVYDLKLSLLQIEGLWNLGFPKSILDPNHTFILKSFGSLASLLTVWWSEWESANRQGEKKIFGLVSFLGVELNVTQAQICWKSLNLLLLGWYSLCEAQENSEITGISENIKKRDISTQLPTDISLLCIIKISATQVWQCLICWSLYHWTFWKALSQLNSLSWVRIEIRGG